SIEHLEEDLFCAKVLPPTCVAGPRLKRTHLGQQLLLADPSYPVSRRGQIGGSAFNRTRKFNFRIAALIRSRENLIQRSVQSHETNGSPLADCGSRLAF